VCVCGVKLDKLSWFRICGMLQESIGLPLLASAFCHAPNYCHLGLILFAESRTLWFVPCLLSLVPGHEDKWLVA
jgi:hypothetical protein